MSNPMNNGVSTTLSEAGENNPNAGPSVLDNSYYNFKTISDFDTFTSITPSSFPFDKEGYYDGLKSTQQLNIDYGKFVNHTFFDSAVSKTNIAFNRIVNEMPFDGTLSELETWRRSLTGFEKHVLDNFASSLGYLILSGTASGESSGGQFIEINDKRGALYPEFSTINDAQPVLSPDSKSFTTEFWLKLPEQSIGKQVICQHKSENSYGHSIWLNNDSSATSATIYFTAVSSSLINSYVDCSATITKGKFNHIAAVYSPPEYPGGTHLYVNGVFESSSSSTKTFEKLDFAGSDYLIGTGSKLSYNSNGSMTDILPVQTLSGAIDEFRFWHSARSSKEIKDNYTNNVFASEDLRLNLRFNEPSGSYNIPSVVLDYSGNSLHSNISGFDASGDVRAKDWGDPPIILEKNEDNIVLFPEFATNSELNITLLTSASDYDDFNPNLITKLVPVHYLLEGRNFEGLSGITGSMADPFKSINIPGSGQLGSGQILASFLLLWAKYFDEIKVYIDVFSKLLTISYETNDYPSEKFLPFIGSRYGFNLPGLFSAANFRQFNEGVDLGLDSALSQRSLNQIQNEMWKRLLVNMKDLISQKGTISSVKGLIRTLGIDPDTIFDIREYGGPRKSFLMGRRKLLRKNLKTINFNTTGSSNATVDKSGFGENSYIISPFLSGARIETGYPDVIGSYVKSGNVLRDPKNSLKVINANTLVHGVSNSPNDGLYTSGSFTFEATYKFPPLPPGVPYPLTQSLVRLMTTGSGVTTLSTGESPFLLANLILISGSYPQVKLYVDHMNVSGDSSPYMRLNTVHINSASLFDGEAWKVSFGLVRGDDTIYNEVKQTSSSLFLHVVPSDSNQRGYFTSSYANHEAINEAESNFNLFRTVDSAYNASGTFFVIGSQSIGLSTSASLNNTNYGREVRSTLFRGKINFIRFWSKGSSKGETKERALNHESMGVLDPRYQFNHSTDITGSFNKVRLDAKVAIQTLSGSDTNGNITIFDYSQNDLHLSGKSFGSGSVPIINNIEKYSILSPKFDIGHGDEKVRIRGFEREENLEAHTWTKLGPVFDIEPFEDPSDDNRFSIDLSSVRALDEDIMKMFSSLESFDDFLGDPRDMFQASYIELENVRKTYFKELISKLNLSAYAEFFTWFDESFSSLIEQFVPMRARFLGVNYVIESHVLERNRHAYRHDEMYKGLARKSAPGADPNNLTN